jgi:hypothetical protein
MKRNHLFRTGMIVFRMVKIKRADVKGMANMHMGIEGPVVSLAGPNE